MELDAIPQPELERIGRAGGADLVVGLFDPQHEAQSGAIVQMVRAALADLSKVARAVVLCNNGTQAPAPTTPDEESAGPSVSVFWYSLPGPAYRSVFKVSEKLGARACGVIASRLEAVTPQWIFSLVQPALDLGFDLVAPRYTRHRMEGLLNRSVLAPLHRALYGERLQNPLGPDFGLSGKLLQKAAAQEPRGARGSETDPIAWMAANAVSSGFRICESNLGARTQSPTDWGSLSGLLADVLGPVFLEMERQAPFWQAVRGSNPVPEFGFPETAFEDTGAVDVHRMRESFQLGEQDLGDVWGLILPPMTLFELRKMARLPPADFRMTDELWARIVYDFALGHRLRVINRDHLLKSITPLYLGWIASYALEMETAGPAQIDARIEQLARAFEAVKPYLVSRWRWPDRFNP